MDVEDFGRYIVKPTLQCIGFYSKANYILLLGTPIIESQLSLLHNNSLGPKFGVYSISEHAYKDAWCYLNRYDHKRLKETCLAACFYDCWPSSDALCHNLRWACIVAYLRYHQANGSIKDEDDEREYAEFFKKHWRSLPSKIEYQQAQDVFEGLIKGF